MGYATHMTKTSIKKMTQIVGIEDVRNVNCTKRQETALLDFFEMITKQMSTNLARQAWFLVKDFTNYKKFHNNAFYLMKDFELIIERKKICQTDQWHGVFTNASKKLKVISTITQS